MVKHVWFGICIAYIYLIYVSVSVPIEECDENDPLKPCVPDKANPNSDVNSTNPDTFPEGNKNDSKNTGQPLGSNSMVDSQNQNNGEGNKTKETNLKHVHHNQVHHEEKSSHKQDQLKKQIKKLREKNQQNNNDAMKSRPSKKDNAPKDTEAKEGELVTKEGKVTKEKDLKKTHKEIQLEDIHIIQKQPKRKKVSKKVNQKKGGSKSDKEERSE